MNFFLVERVGCPISDFRCQILDVVKTSDIGHHTSDIGYHTSDIGHQ